MSAGRQTRRALAAAVLLATVPFGCIASSVVAPEQRLVAEERSQLAFSPAAANDVVGFHESVDIQGDAAVSLRRIWYVVLADGAYTGAALAEVDGQLAFQTLTGTWALGPAGLVLDGAAAVPCESAPGHLRLSAPGGAVVLRRGALQ